MNEVLNTQVGGDHYTKMKIQPTQLGYILNATPCFVKLAKYLTREKDDKMGNLEKALHVIMLEKELISSTSLYYCEDNGMGFREVGDDVNVNINNFSKQFSHSDIIYDALNNMSGGWYTEAAVAVSKLMEIYK